MIKKKIILVAACQPSKIDADEKNVILKTENSYSIENLSCNVFSYLSFEGILKENCITF